MIGIAILPPEVRFAIEKVIDYCQPGEQQHYEENDRPAGHVAEDIAKVRNWLDSTLTSEPPFLNPQTNNGNEQPAFLRKIMD